MKVSKQKLLAFLVVFLLASSVAFLYIHPIPFIWASPDWLSGWSYRKQITITGQSGAGTNYQVLLKVGESSGSSGADFHVEGHCTDFPNDIRFTDNDGITLLEYWLEKTEGTSPNRVAYFWVEVADDLGSNVDVYIYYGKSGESSASDADATFLISDDFTGSDGDDADPTKWDTLETNSAECRVDIRSNKERHHKHAGSTWNWAGIVSKTTFDLGTSSGVRVLSKNHLGTVATYSFYYCIEVTPDNTNANHDNVQNLIALAYLYPPIPNWKLFWRNAGTSYEGTTSVSPDTTEHTFEILYTKSHFKWIRDGTTEIDEDLDPGYATTTNYLRTCLWYNSGAADRWDDIDWIRVGKYVSPEPSFSSAGNEEASLRYITFNFTVGGEIACYNWNLSSFTQPTNNSEVEFVSNMIIKLMAVPQNESYVFESWNWTGGSSTSNPYNYTVTANMTIWCYFDETPTGDGVPYIVARFTLNISNPTPNATILFNGSMSGSSGSITSYSWNFGDGNSDTGSVVTHSYTSEGNYTVTLTVSGDAGTDSHEQIVSVAKRGKSSAWVFALGGIIALICIPAAILIWRRS